MIRAFIAVEIDFKVKEKLSDLISNLKKSNADIKWVTENQMHLTLKFLGNIEEQKARGIYAYLETINKNFGAFTLTLSQIGAFPDMRRPRVIWIDIDKGRDALKLLADQIERESEKLGFPREKRGFKAHLTLGRVKSLKNITALIDVIDRTDSRLEDEIKIEKVTLFQSTLTPKGAIYTPLKY